MLHIPRLCSYIRPVFILLALLWASVGAQAQVGLIANDINVKDFGARGDGVTDDTAAIQAALNTSFATLTAIPVVFPAGAYLISSRLKVGKDNKRINGFVLTGAGGKGSEIIYSGPAADGALQILNIKWGRIQNIRVRSRVGSGYGTRAAFGIWLDADETSSGGQISLIDVSINNFSDGIRVGRPPDTGDDIEGGVTASSVEGDVFTNLEVLDCDIAVHLIGANTDGQYFYGLSTQANKYVIYAESSRNIHVYGGLHSNTGLTGFDKFYYLKVVGADVGGGGYTIDGIRCEQCPGIAWIGPSSGNDGRPVSLAIRNFTIASSRAGLTGPTKVLHFGEAGNVSIEDCEIKQSGAYFHFEDFRNSRYAELVLKNNRINNPSPEIVGSLITASDITKNGGTAGGVRIHLTGNLQLNDSGAIVSRIRDRIVLRTTSDIDNGKETVLADFSQNGGLVTPKANSATTTWNPPNIANGASASILLSVPGAKIGDPVSVGFSQLIPAGATLAGMVTAPDTLTVTLSNKTGITFDLPSGTLRAYCWK